MAVERGYERVAVTRPADSNLGPIRARMPASIAEMRRLRAAGVAVDVIAEQFGINRRTAYRYLVDAEYVQWTVDGWTAWFAVSTGKPLWRVSPWSRA